jgi:Tetratricopeptide repeat
MKAPFVLLVSFALLTSVASRAAAQEGSSTTFFAEGQRLMAQGKFQEACPKFEKALALNPGAGTKFNLAECYEKIGRLAASFTLFREVEDVTRQVGQKERSGVAKQRADALEPRIPAIVVRAPWLADLPRAQVSLDGHPLSPDAIDKPIRVDLGVHVAVVRVDGLETRLETTVDKEGETRSLVLAAPRQEPAPVARKEALVPPVASGEAPRDGQAQRTVGLVVGGVGVVTAGVAAVLVLRAKSSYGDATSSCGTSCPHDETLRANDARDAANVGGIVLGVGLACVAAGAVVFLTAPSAPPRATGTGFRIAPGAARGSLGLTASGTF